MTNLRRIDVHQHLLPPEYLAALKRHGESDWAPESWSASGAIAMMDALDISTGILSLSTPGPFFGDDAEASALSNQVNERLANLVKERPDRFGMFASLPLPDIDGTLKIVRSAYDDLGTDGVILLANNRGTYLGDKLYEPVMDELDRRSAIAFVHPGPLPGPSVPGIHPSIADFLLDTTRAALNLVLNGVSRRYPNIRFILSHAGGFVPYAAHRIANLAQLVDGHVDATSVLADLSKFYFDTALSGSPTALPSLLAFAKPGHVLFGSDWPYCPTEEVTVFTAGLDGYDRLDKVSTPAIDSPLSPVITSPLTLLGYQAPEAWVAVAFWAPEERRRVACL